MFWRFYNSDEKLWKRILLSIHELPNSFLSILELHSVKTGPLEAISSSMKQLSWFNNIVETSFTASLGNGHKFQFWEHVYIQNSPLITTFPRIFSISTQQSYLICNTGVWDGDEWNWKFHWRRNLYQ